MENTSVKLVRFLQTQGRSQKQVAELMEISESYVSKVMSGERQFSLKHFEMIGDKLKLPTHLLLLRLVDLEEIPESLRSGYQTLVSGLESCYQENGEMVEVQDDFLDAYIENSMLQGHPG